MQLETNCSSMEIWLETPVSSSLIIQSDSSALVRCVTDIIFMFHILHAQCRGLNKSSTHLWFSTCNPHVCYYCCVHTDGCLWFFFKSLAANEQYKHVFRWIAWQNIRNVHISRLRKEKPCKAKTAWMWVTFTDNLQLWHFSSQTTRVHVVSHPYNKATDGLEQSSCAEDRIGPSL